VGRDWLRFLEHRREILRGCTQSDTNAYAYAYTHANCNANIVTHAYLRGLFGD
jgi:hypothetical protein